ncbi:MAG: hypothetical protein R3268_06755 [Acidiferrobacterales bacterium]|nr:hypothetical protein [Acidiferrobacterales bacterium]
MKSRSPNQESYQEQPNKKIGGKKNAQGLNKGCSREGEKPSVDRAVPNPDTTWDELSQAAILLLPSVAEVDIHEWLIDLLECVAKKHPILKGEAGYLQGLVRNALTDLSDELSHQSEGQHKKPHEIVDWVFGWIDRYGNSE